jgi:DNA-binding CsgD family transcriptional regulator
VIRCLAEPRREILLRPLEDWAIGQLLRNRLGPRWTPPVSAGVARASGGNPFLALEIARAMQAELSNASGTTRHGQDAVFPVPASLADLLHERVAQLPQDAREILLLASAAGRLTVAQLQDAVEQEQLRSALEAAADADVATVNTGSVITFTHPLLASAIYDAAAPVNRRRAHRILADTLGDPVERARHRCRSITIPDEAVAAELEQAADISRDRGALQLTGELLEAAALATPSDLDATAGWSRWLRAVDTYNRAGDEAAAQAALDKGSALATTPQQQAQVLLRRARLANKITEARFLAEKAFRLASPGSDVRAAILERLSAYHRIEGHGAVALRLSQWAIIEAAALQRSDIQVAALYERQAIERTWGVGQPERTSRNIEPLSDGSDLSLRWACARGFHAAWNDETAEKQVRDGIAWAVDGGRYGHLASLYISLIVFLIRASKIREAQAALDDSDRVGAWTTSDGAQEAMGRVMIKAMTGDLDVARAAAQHALQRPQIRGSPYWRGGFLAQIGFVEASGRNWHPALTALRELADIFATTKMVDLEQLLWGVDYADAALQVGALPDVEAAIAILRRQAGSGRPEADVAADRCKALLTATRGDIDTALHDLCKIIDQPGSECPFETARSRLALGQVYRRAGYKGMASQALNAAADAFDELGIPQWARRAHDEAARVGLHPTTSVLTATERRIAELVAAGYSNREAATELFMSVKTVEANLTRIYRKLTVRSRTELVNHMNRFDSANHHDQ